MASRTSSRSSALRTLDALADVRSCRGTDARYHGLAVHLGIGIPNANSTQIADLGRASAPTPVFAAFQVTTSLLLLAAASSSFQAGPGLLKALSRRTLASGRRVGVLPELLGASNRHHTPYWGVVLYAIMSAAVILASGAQDQVLVLYYAVSVFLAFLAGLLGMREFP